MLKKVLTISSPHPYSYQMNGDLVCRTIRFSSGTDECVTHQDTMNSQQFV
jgi:hypothetical protein